jgi:ubiquitin thioesterase protein OTUB1
MNTTTDSRRTNDDSIAAQMAEDENFGSVAEGVFESRQRQEDAGFVGQRTPTVERLMARQQPVNSAQGYHSSLSEGVASAGNPNVMHGTERNIDIMGDFVPGERGGSEVVGGNSQMEGRRTADWEHIGETTQSVMHESNMLYYDGDNDIEGTNTPARFYSFQNQSDERLRTGRRESYHGDLDQSPAQVAHSPPKSSFRQVPSECAMVTGLSDGDNDMAGGRKESGGAVQFDRNFEPTDSNMGCIDDGMVPCSGSFKNRPSDADIIAWENHIKERGAQKRLLIGSKVSLEDLAEEYEHGSNAFKTKIGCLSTSYGSMRRCRGDGNCFFRSFIFAHLEYILSTSESKEKYIFISTVERVRGMLLEAGYEELVFEGPMELLLDLLRCDISNIDTLEERMRTDDVSNYIVFLLRIITSAEVKANRDFFAPFIMGLVDMGVDEFCSKCIDPMGEESDHVQLVALTNALQVPVRVIYLDNRMKDGLVDRHDFVPDGCSEQGIHVHLLYRPGHYDILYAM